MHCPDGMQTALFAAALPLLGNSYIYKLVRSKHANLARQVNVDGVTWYEPSKPFRDFEPQQQALLPRAAPSAQHHGSSSEVLSWRVYLPPWLADVVLTELVNGRGSVQLSHGVRAAATVGSTDHTKEVAITGAPPSISDADLLAFLSGQRAVGRVQFDTLDLRTDEVPLPLCAGQPAAHSLHPPSRWRCAPAARGAAGTRGGPPGPRSRYHAHPAQPDGPRG